jgi:hypothetical protein
MDRFKSVWTTSGTVTNAEGSKCTCRPLPGKRIEGVLSLIGSMIALLEPEIV